MSVIGSLGATLIVTYAAGAGGPAQAGEAWSGRCDEPFSVSATYRADVVSVLDGGIDNGAGVADSLDVEFDVDLSKAMRWAGASAHLHLMNNAGEALNDRAGTLQGIDNIEVERQRARIFEAWIEQRFASDRASVRAGLYDLNSEFYVTESAGLLMAPAFGIGSELAATGPNGPSIFPSTALAVRLDWRVDDALTLRGALLNARAGVLGDPGSVDTDFDDGALFIVEGAWRGPLALSLGAWRYSERQDDTRAVDLTGAPVQRLSQGAYFSAERRFFDQKDGGARTTGFLRAGFSDGDTTDYESGWQAGVLIEGIVPSRAESALSLGAYQGVVSNNFRSNRLDAGDASDRSETAVELTYSDRIHKHVLVQPDLQFFPNPSADPERSALWVAAIRFTVEIN